MEPKDGIVNGGRKLVKINIGTLINRDFFYLTFGASVIVL
jgi:hypothetical protein